MSWKGRACGTCEWAIGERLIDGVEVNEIGEAALVCVEGPHHEPVHPAHFCSRWRLAEELAGNRDIRKPKGGKA